METTVFKEIKNKNLSQSGKEEISAWPFPSERPESSKLSSIKLSRKGEDPKQGPGNQIPRYFYKVFDRTDGIEETDEAQYPQFTITYGNRNGGGAPKFFDENGNKTGSTRPTKAIYSQYESVLLEQGEKSFGFRKDHFYAINFSGRVLRNGLVPNTFELTLSFEEKDITLILDPDGMEGTFVQPGGSIEFEPSEIQREGEYPIYRKNPIFGEGQTNAPNFFAAEGIPSAEGVNQTGRTYGFIYPKQGTIILDPDMIAEEISAKEQFIPEIRSSAEILNTEEVSATFIQPGDSLSKREIVRGEYQGFVYKGGFGGNMTFVDEKFPDWPYVRNHDKFFKAMQRGQNFKMNVNKKTVKSSYEIEIGPDEFNHSTNPTYSDKSGKVKFPGDNSYFTTVGLYNDDKQLLAIAKLEHPTETEESDLTIEIEY